MKNALSWKLMPLIHSVANMKKNIFLSFRSQYSYNWAVHNTQLNARIYLWYSRVLAISAKEKKIMACKRNMIMFYRQYQTRALLLLPILSFILWYSVIFAVLFLAFFICSIPFPRSFFYIFIVFTHLAYVQFFCCWLQFLTMLSWHSQHINVAWNLICMRFILFLLLLFVFVFVFWLCVGSWMLRFVFKSCVDKMMIQQNKFVANLWFRIMRSALNSRGLK